VPDSAEAEYDQYRFDLEYVYFSLAGNLSLQGEVEFRDYAQPSGRDDFTAFGFTGRFGRPLSNRLEAGLVLWVDIYRYKNPDIVNRNYAHIRGEVEGIVRVNGFGWGPLVKTEIRDEKAVDDYVFDNFNESYRQWEVGIRAEYLTRRELYFDGEATYGRRDYTGGSSILSSYNLWTVSCIAGYSIMKNISLNLMFDGSLERHKLTEENTDLYLFSAGVTARI
jgi:hypothetical protein